MSLVARYCPWVLAGVVASAGFWMLLHAPDLVAFGVAAWIVAFIVVLHRPEIVLTFAALVVPAGSFHPSLVGHTPLGNLTVVQGLALSLALPFALLRPQAAKEGLRGPVAILGYAFALAGFVGAVANGEPSALYWVVNLGGVLVAFSILLTTRYRTNRRSVEGWVIAGALAIAASVLLERALGAHVAWVPMEAPKIDALQFRPSGSAGNSLLSGAVCAVMFAVSVTSPVARRWVGTLIIAAGFAIAAVVTLSRSAILAVAVVVGLLALRKSTIRTERVARLAALLLVVPAFIWLWLGASDLITKRLGGQTLGGRSDAQRLFTLNYAIDLFRADPWFGLGLGGFKRVAQDTVLGGSLATVDNFFLTLVVEVGVFGIIVLATGIASIILSRRARGRESPLGSALPLVAIWVVALFFDAFYHDPMIFLLAIAVLRATTPVGHEQGRLDPGPGRGRRRARLAAESVPVAGPGYAARVPGQARGSLLRARLGGRGSVPGAVRRDHSVLRGRERG